MTRKLLHFILAIAVLLSVSALAQNGIAAAPSVPTPAATNTKIGIINIQEAIFASNEGRRDFEALNKKFEPKQSELQTINKEIDDLKKQLTAQGDKLNEDAKSVQVRQIEQKQKSLQRSYEDAQAEFQGQQNEILNRIGQKLLGVLDKYAKDNGYTLILDVSSQQSPVLWAGPSSNVTEPIGETFCWSHPAKRRQAVNAFLHYSPTGHPCSAETRRHYAEIITLNRDCKGRFGGLFLLREPRKKRRTCVNLSAGKLSEKF